MTCRSAVAAPPSDKCTIDMIVSEPWRDLIKEEYYESDDCHDSESFNEGEEISSRDGGFPKKEIPNFSLFFGPRAPPLREDIIISSEKLSMTAEMLQSITSLDRPPTKSKQKKQTVLYSKSTLDKLPLQKQNALKHRVKLMVFVRVLLVYLQRVDLNRALKAKSCIAECYQRHRSGDPNYRSLANCMQSSLREVVGEFHWNRAEQIHRQAQFRYQRKMNLG